MSFSQNPTQNDVAEENEEITENLIPREHESSGVMLPGGAVVGEVFFNNEPQIEQQDGEDVEYDDSKPRQGDNDDEFNEETRHTVDYATTPNKIRPMTICFSVIVFLLSLLITICSLFAGIFAIIGLFNISRDLKAAQVDNGWGATQWGVVVSRVVMLIPPFVGVFVGPIGMFQACVVMCTMQALKLKLCWAGLYFVGLLILVLSYMFSFSTTTLFDVPIYQFSASSPSSSSNLIINPWIVWALKILAAIVVSVATFACCGICCFPCSVAQLFAIEFEIKRPASTIMSL